MDLPIRESIYKRVSKEDTTTYMVIDVVHNYYSNRKDIDNIGNHIVIFKAVDYIEFAEYDGTQNTNYQLWLPNEVIAIPLREFLFNFEKINT